MTLLAELINLPEDVRRGDFVLRLSEGVARADATLADQVMTDSLARCRDAVLSLVGSALDARTSKAAYLHGSFGSGKCRFVAVLDLLLAGNPDARARTELAPVIAWGSCDPCDLPSRSMVTPPK